MNPQRTISPRAWAELLLLATIWGGSFIGNRLALVEFGVLSTVAFRVGGACLILWCWVALRRLPLPRDPGVWGAFLVMGFLNNALPFTLITWGQVTIPSGLAAILNASTAILGVLVAALVFRDERLTGRRLAGVALGFAGVVVVIGIESLARLDLTSLAQLALLGASLSYATAAAWARVRLSGLAPQVAAAGMLTGATLIMFPAALLVEGMPSLHHGPVVWGALTYLAVISTAFAYLLYYRVLGMAGAGNLSLVTLLIAPIAVIMGALILNESLPLRDFIGFALLAAGLMVIDGRAVGRFRAYFA
ncbi:MAG TPA: DMT family transporter [Paracoccaceae bacterium]